MADNIMNDNAKDNNADTNVIEFDSKVTEKDLLRFKFYHKYHTCLLYTSDAADE